MAVKDGQLWIRICQY